MPPLTKQAHPPMPVHTKTQFREGRRSVLVVEDDLMMGLFLEQYIGSQYDVTVCRDGSEALSTLRSGLRPDLVVTDLSLPGLDGFQVLDRARSIGLLDDQPVLVLSGSEKSDDRVRALRAGADDFLLKPFNPDELMARLANLFRRIKVAA